MSNNPFLNNDLPYNNTTEADILTNFGVFDGVDNPDKILIKNLQESIENFKKKHLMDQATISHLTQQYNYLNNAYSQLTLQYNYLNHACTQLNQEYNSLKLVYHSALSEKEKKMSGGKNNMKAKKSLSDQSNKTKKTKKTKMTKTKRKI